MSDSTGSPWQLVPLGTLAEFRNGINYTKQNFGKGIKVINVGDFGDRSVVSLDELDEVNPENLVREANLLQDDDIIFVRSNGNRMLIGRSLFIQNVREPVTHSAFTIRTRFTSEQTLPRFYAYLFRSDLIRQVLSAYGGGTNISNLNQQILSNLPVPFPPLSTQRKIAAILSAYDDLIENNTRRIAILEEMAQLIYREWFVHFRFPGHEDVEMVESELGPIPEGWGTVKLGDITTKIGSGSTPRGGKESYKQAGISLIRSLNVYDFRFDRAGLAFIDDGQAEKLSNVVVESRDILLNITGASVARCCMVPDHILPARVNQHVAIVRVDSNCVSPFYVLHSINSHRYKELLLTMAQGGATREALTKRTITNFEIIHPPKAVIDAFGAVAQDISEQQEILQRRNNVLRHTRDLLLPRLVSGEVDVSELDIDLEGLDQ